MVQPTEQQNSFTFEQLKSLANEDVEETAEQMTSNNWQHDIRAKLFLS